MAACRDWWRVDVHAEAYKPPTEFVFFFKPYNSHTICTQLPPHKRAHKGTEILSKHLCNVLNLISVYLFLSKIGAIKPVDHYIKLVYGPRLETGTRYIILPLYKYITWNQWRCSVLRFFHVLPADGSRLPTSATQPPQVWQPLQLWPTVRGHSAFDSF